MISFAPQEQLNILSSTSILHPTASDSVFRYFCLLQRIPPLSLPLLPKMSFTQHLQLLLDPASTLPLYLDLGKYSCSWDNGKFKIAHEEAQPGFRKLTRDELMKLMRRLHVAPHAVLLNLYGHSFGEDLMQEMEGPMAALSKLEALVLSCTRPPPPPYCILRIHVSITTAATTATPSLAP